MKKLVILIFILIFLILIISTSNEPDYSSLKNEYIKNHSGQAIIPFPWDPSTSKKVLPFNYEIPAAPGNTFSMTACRNEFEPASFIINAQKDLSGITIIVPNLYDAQGNSIPSDAINVRIVKAWYQADDDGVYLSNPEQRYLIPELLLKDDTLINVDYITKTNYLRVTINDVEQYIDISNPAGTFPSNAQIHDASSLQQFSLKANENKQIWITVHVPTNTFAGDYHGNITINAPSEAPVTMNFSVTVLPFDLEPSLVEYGLYYTGDLYPPIIGFSSDKTAANMLIELQNMKDHGVLYPTFYQHRNDEIDAALDLRDTVGFPKDKIYTLGGGYSLIENTTDTAGLATIANNVNQMRGYTESHGYTDTYFYGMDEAQGDVLLSQRQAWQTVHDNGGKIWASGHGYELIKMVDILDTSVVAYELIPSVAAQWHSNGKRILSYQNPQVGVEDPEIYRKNYGFALWNAGYDGTMAFAYQYAYGDIWNDFDDGHFRDHVFTYPTSNGVIDTIQWEGWREGVDDTRYVASLIKKEGSNTSVKAIVSSSLSQGDNMTTIREKVIAQILSLTH